MADAPPAWDKITIHNLLTHTAGVPNFTSFPDYATTKALPSPAEKTVARFRDKPLDFEPGSKFSYSNLRLSSESGSFSTRATARQIWSGTFPTLLSRFDTTSRERLFTKRTVFLFDWLRRLKRALCADIGSSPRGVCLLPAKRWTKSGRSARHGHATCRRRRAHVSGWLCPRPLAQQPWRRPEKAPLRKLLWYALPTEQVYSPPVPE